HPVNARQPRVQNTVIDIPGHLLRANQHALDLRIVDGRKVRPPVRKDPPAGALEQRDGGVLQASLGNPQPQLVRHQRTSPSTVAPTGIGRVKQLTVPSWQTSPSPSTCTRNSSVS